MAQVKSLFLSAGSGQESHSQLVDQLNPEWNLAPRNLMPEFAAKGHEVSYLSFLERKISRNPRDLISHTQRVFLFHREKEKVACLNALLDLYLVLGQRGYELRKSVLLKVKNSLTRPQREFFARYLRRGMTRKDASGMTTTSLLSEGLESKKPLVTLKGLSPKTVDLKEIAYALLDQDMIEESCRVWEKILLEDPGSAIATMEVLSIYQHYSMKDDFFRIYMDLSGRKLVLPELWEQLDTYFRSQSFKTRAMAH